MIYVSSKLGFDQAVNYISAMVQTGTHTGFFVETEFGRIAVEVTRRPVVNTIERYVSTRWNSAPVTSFVRENIRYEVDSYISIPYITGSDIVLKLTVAMALSGCLLRYVTSGTSIIDSDDMIKYVACCWLRHYTNYAAAGMTKEYLNTVSFRDRVGNRLFVADYFHRVQAAAVGIARKNSERFHDLCKIPVKFDNQDGFSQRLFEAVVVELGIRVTEDNLVGRKIIELNNEKMVTTVPYTLKCIYDANEEQHKNPPAKEKKGKNSTHT